MTMDVLSDIRLHYKQSNQKRLSRLVYKSARKGGEVALQDDD